VAALSFAVSLYFEGWVEALAEQIGRTEDPDGQRLYSIYSGGDDLFFVGAWDAVVELARVVRRDLARFAADHPGIHASAGVVLVGGKYPLYQAARDAGGAEHQAKSLQWQDQTGKKRTKDAVTFLGQTMPWERFGLEACDQQGIATAHTLAHTLEWMVNPPQGDTKKVPQTLLNNLIHTHEMHEATAEGRRRRGVELGRSDQEQVYWGPWMWRGYYRLKQMAKRYKDDERGETIGALAKQLYDDDFRAIDWIGLAARWADLLTR
jgi:CRISPR-associated protein Csm1